MKEGLSGNFSSFKFIAMSGCLLSWCLPARYAYTSVSLKSCRGGNPTENQPNACLHLQASRTERLEIAEVLRGRTFNRHSEEECFEAKNLDAPMSETSHTFANSSS
jgi:hypothetical protein